MNRETAQKIKAELETIQAADDEQLIKVEAVVEFAKNPNTELHKHFTWDVSEAAQKRWIDEARDIIQKVKITIINDDKPVEFRAVVSIVDDRVKPGGGYRMLSDVLADPAYRQSYLQTALMELNSFKQKYEKLKELSPVFEAIAKVEKIAKRQKPKTTAASKPKRAKAAKRPATVAA